MPADKVTRPLLFGSDGAMALALLETLLACGVEPLGVVLPGPAWRALSPPPSVGELPMLPSPVHPTLAARAWAAALPVWSLGSVDALALEGLRALAPPVIVVACWPRRLPTALLQLPTHGVLNIHPSLLPAFRGPAPLFWQLRAGVRRGGVSIHRMTERLDEGPLLWQQPLTLPDGASGAALDRWLGRHAGQALPALLTALATGRARSTPQPPGGSYQGWPDGAAWEVPTEWSARRAWNFMRGTASWGQPYYVPLPEGPLRVAEALAVAPRASLARPFVQRGAALALRFTPGVLLVRPHDA